MLVAFKSICREKCSESESKTLLVNICLTLVILTTYLGTFTLVRLTACVSPDIVANITKSQLLTDDEACQVNNKLA